MNCLHTYGTDRKVNVNQKQNGCFGQHLSFTSCSLINCIMTTGVMTTGVMTTGIMTSCILYSCIFGLWWLYFASKDTASLAVPGQLRSINMTFCPWVMITDPSLPCPFAVDLINLHHILASCNWTDTNLHYIYSLL